MQALLPLFDPGALRTLEARGAAHHGGDAFALMARAGQDGWRNVLEHWPQAQRVLVVCGPGNNGGDGFVLARHARAAGRDVCVLQLPAHSPMTPLAQRARDEYVAAGGVVSVFTGTLPEVDLTVDALFGIGLSRAPDPTTTALIEAINAQPSEVLALDVPSGIDARCGSAPGAAVRAVRTLQFLARHRGLRTGDALDHCGQLDLATLGLPEALFDGVAPAAMAWRTAALREHLSLRSRDSHKGVNGHVLCIGGDHGCGGAVLLAAQAALRCGAGLVSVATRAAHVPSLLARCPEVMAQGVEDGEQLQPLLERADVVAIGPGLGCGAWGRALMGAALVAGKPCVVDADALNLIAVSGVRLSPGAIITPHPGEAARLLHCTTADVQADRFVSAATLAVQLDCVVVLKGAGSLVQSGSEPTAVICAGNPGMSTGGMGDLLTGCIAALRAQGFPAAMAARVGALLHAAAGDAAAREDGERGLLPTDLLPWLRRLANPVRR